MREWTIYRTDENGEGAWSVSGNLTWAEAEAELKWNQDRSPRGYFKIGKA